ncbi:unnamed protein product [Toxocara canis]|uniref:Ovule protein n=2 Tax=Toxocara canis TaxID=6265 RepID=A0A183UW85_TOXCA|nr:unnamed protein product [Toxocara canis]
MNHIRYDTGTAQLGNLKPHSTNHLQHPLLATLTVPHQSTGTVPKVAQKDKTTIQKSQQQKNGMTSKEEKQQENSGK